RAVRGAPHDGDFGLGRVAVLDRLVAPHIDRERGAGRGQREGAALRFCEGTAVTAATAAAGEGEAGEQQPQGLAESFHVVVSRTASSRIRMPEASSMGVCAGAHLRLSLRIRGVTKIRSSALVSLRPLFLNRLPS